MDDAVASVLDRAFPDRTVASVGPPGISWNEGNETVRVDFADGDSVYCKTALDGKRSRLRCERAVIPFVDAETSIPVPSVVASDVDGDPPFLATAPVAGPSLHEVWGDANAAERTALAREIGTALATLHECTFPEHGHVTGGGADGLGLETKPWSDLLVDRIEGYRTLAPSDRFDHHFDEVIAAVEANRGLLDDAPAALIHGDPAMPNGIRGEDAIGFLDWELACVGDPAKELVRSEGQTFGSDPAETPERLIEAFRDGYRDRAGALPTGIDDRRPVYESVRFLIKSGYFENWVEYFDESPEAFATYVADEMDRRLARIP